MSVDLYILGIATLNNVDQEECRLLGCGAV
jgi:hypothetical protein